jgi:hypothetical protein
MSKARGMKGQKKKKEKKKIKRKGKEKKRKKSIPYFLCHTTRSSVLSISFRSFSH